MPNMNLGVYTKFSKDSWKIIIRSF